MRTLSINVTNTPDSRLQDLKRFIRSYSFTPSFQIAIQSNGNATLTQDVHSETDLRLFTKQFSYLFPDFKLVV